MEFTVGELAGRLKLPMRGDANRSIAAAAMLEGAGPGDLAFIGSPKFFAAGTVSKAGCLIALAEYPADSGQTVIVSPQPRAHFAQALALLYPAQKIQPG